MPEYTYHTDYYLFRGCDEAVTFGHDVAYTQKMWDKYENPDAAYLYKVPVTGSELAVYMPQPGACISQENQFICSWTEIEMNVKQ